MSFQCVDDDDDDDDDVTLKLNQAGYLNLVMIVLGLDIELETIRTLEREA